MQYRAYIKKRFHMYLLSGALVVVLQYRAPLLLPRLKGNSALASVWN